MEKFLRAGLSRAAPGDVQFYQMQSAPGGKRGVRGGRFPAGTETFSLALSSNLLQAIERLPLTPMTLEEYLP